MRLPVVDHNVAEPGDIENNAGVGILFIAVLFAEILLFWAAAISISSPMKIPCESEVLLLFRGNRTKRGSGLL